MEIIKPAEVHKATVILLHGRDSTAAEFATELFESQASNGGTLLQNCPHIKWVFPSAPLLVSQRFGAEMSQWFDMWSTEDPHERPELQHDGLDDTIRKIQRLVDTEASIIGSQNIFLGGISQGGATAIRTALQKPCSLGGFIGLCTWFPRWDLDQRPEADYILCRTPVFLAHSQDDEVIAIKHGEDMRDTLTKLGMSVAWHEYQEGGHWLNEPASIDDIIRFLDAHILQPTG